MFGSLRGYARYVPSGFAEIGSIPSHWKVARLGQIGSFAKGIGGTREDDVADSGVPCIRYGDLYRGLGPLTHKAITHIAPESLNRYTRLAKGDILFALSGEMVAEIGKSTVVMSDEIPACGGDLAIYRVVGDVDSAYFGYLLESRPLTWQKARRARGDIIVHVSPNALKTMGIPLPPRDEQSAIVRYLAHANLRIDQTIAAKRKLIRLLEEQKQVIINQAVTCGLDPNVPMKDTGEAWLREIPEHWDLLRARFIFREVDVRSETGSEPPLSMSQKQGLVPAGLVQRTLSSATLVGAKVCQPGDLVLNRLKAHLGVFAVSKHDGVVSPDYSVFRLTRSDRAGFYELVLKSPAIRVELRRRIKGIVEGFWRLYTIDFFDLRLPSPPEAEQAEILDLISEETRTADEAIRRLADEIDLLREFRTRLTADVVTGQVDVREIASTLPDLDPDELVGADSAAATEDDDLDGAVDESSDES